MKKLIKSLIFTVLLLILCLGTYTGSLSVSEDPADSYVPQKAEYEDASLKLWFEHSFKKVFTSDITPSGMDTYSVYMAKNEIENAQFILYSEAGLSSLTASVTDFTDGAGNSIPAELYYEMYVTTENLRSDMIAGLANKEDSFIRAGETPDPVVPLSKLKNFTLNPGKSQAFLIKLKTASDTPSGWYSSTLNIYDSEGRQIKTAKVFAYVWNFELSEKTSLKTAMFLTRDVSYGGTYEAFYNYLLENRLVAMDMPGGFRLDNKYLYNDRVNAVRVSAVGGGDAQNSEKPYYMDHIGSYYKYKDIYNEFSNSPYWDIIKEKFYFYTVDEPRSQEDYIYNKKETIDDVKYASNLLSMYWEDAPTLVPYQDDHPYPYNYYTSSLDNYSPNQLKDATQEMMDTGSCVIWVPQIHAFTPTYEINKYGTYTGLADSKLRNLSGDISGAINYGQRYYNWEKIYGEFNDRINSYIKVENAKGGNYQLWAYGGGFNKAYTYCNHLIENTGLQTKMLFWQFYQNNVDGYLYYGTNNWNEYNIYSNNYVDKTVTGTKTAGWKTNKLIYPQTGYNIYGNGVLFYGKTQARITTIDYAGSLRVEIMRDGIEDYQMMKMLEEYKGNEAAQSFVSKVSLNVANYLSLPAFTPDGWPKGTDEYEIMAEVRKMLGNAVEAAASKAACKHNYGAGEVVTPAGCITAGTMKYTCTKCGAVNTEIIPTLHTTGETFTVKEKSAPTCTADGYEILKCSVCSYEKTNTLLAYHNDPNACTYEMKNEAVHNTICPECKQIIDAPAHRFFIRNTNTCTEDGWKTNECTFCGYTENIEALPAAGHTFLDGKCTVCGINDPSLVQYEQGDVNRDGKINLMDAFLLKIYCKSLSTPDDEVFALADLNVDKKLNLMDIYLLKVKIKNK